MIERQAHRKKEADSEYQGKLKERIASNDVFYAKASGKPFGVGTEGESQNW